MSSKIIKPFLNFSNIQESRNATDIQLIQDSEMMLVNNQTGSAVPQKFRKLGAAEKNSRLGNDKTILNQTLSSLTEGNHLI